MNCHGISINCHYKLVELGLRKDREPPVWGAVVELQETYATDTKCHKHFCG